MSELTVRPHMRFGWSRVADWCVRTLRAARPGGVAALRSFLAAVVALRGLAGLVLISYGAWLAYPPAGFILAGVLLLADRVLDERKEPPR